MKAIGTSRSAKAPHQPDAEEHDHDQPDGLGNARPRPLAAAARHPGEDQRRHEHGSEPVAQHPEDQRIQELAGRDSTGQGADGDDDGRGGQRPGRAGHERQDDRVADPFEPRVELQRAKNPDHDHRLHHLRQRGERGPRQGLVADVQGERAKDNARQKAEATQVGDGHRQANRWPERRQRPAIHHRQKHQLGQPPGKQGHDQVEDHVADRWMGGKPAEERCLGGLLGHVP
jgi:hypothetical protein